MALQQEPTFSFVFSALDVRLRVIITLNGIWVWQIQLAGSVNIMRE